VRKTPLLDSVIGAQEVLFDAEVVANGVEPPVEVAIEVDGRERSAVRDEAELGGVAKTRMSSSVLRYA
jgi:hypothetical protein